MRSRFSLLLTMLACLLISAPVRAQHFGVPRPLYIDNQTDDPIVVSISNDQFGAAGDHRIAPHWHGYLQDNGQVLSVFPLANVSIGGWSRQAAYLDWSEEGQQGPHFKIVWTNGSSGE